MVPDIHTLEKSVLEHRHTLLCEAEHERMLAVAHSPKHASDRLQRFAGKLGMILIVVTSERRNA
jgi:hypothetical protein